MRSFIKIAFVGAIALASLVACNKEATDNPNYDAKTRTVNADFVFNVSTGMTPQTKMNSANTQATIAEAFRGISDAQLFAYKLGTTNDGKHVATATNADKTYTLGNLLAAGALDPDGTPKSRRVIELALPVETNALMFWGKAPQSGTDPDKNQGKITFQASDANIANHAFSLVRSFPAGDEAAFVQYEQILLAAMNSLSNFRFQAGAGELTWSASEGGDGSTNASAIDVYWSDFVNVDGGTGAITKVTTSPINPAAPLSSNGEIFAEAYKALHNVYTDELRAGSGPAIHRMFADLYNICNSVTSTNASTYLDFITKQFASSLKDELGKLIDVSQANLPLRGINNIKTSYGLTANTLATEDLDKFPGEIYHLPMGGLQLKVAANPGSHPVHTWSYNNTATGPGGAFAYNKVMFPAEICYFGNAPLRVSDTPHLTADYPDGSGTAAGEWMNDASWTADWSVIGKHVLSTTRSVAMAHNINYGSALLKSTVKYGAANLEDNNAAIQADRNGATEPNNTIDVTSGGMFEIVGILVGGQEQTMGWNYIAKSAAPTYDNVIYDKAIVSATIPAYDGTSTSDPNYTLVWDNYNPTLAANAQQVVNVALELKNTSGTDFWGEKNLVRNGGIFYLIGKLDPTAVSGTITWPTNYALPPYAADGSTIEAKRVFIQDFMTTANFVLGATSLQHAYVTVPDLRSTQISLGLSVDLSWSTGLTFDDVILGSN